MTHTPLLAHSQPPLLAPLVIAGSMVHSLLASWLDLAPGPHRLSGSLAPCWLLDSLVPLNLPSLMKHCFKLLKQPCPFVLLVITLCLFLPSTQFKNLAQQTIATALCSFCYSHFISVKLWNCLPQDVKRLTPHLNLPD